MTAAPQLTMEVHFAFRDPNDHAMDAFVFNGGEHDLLLLMRRVSEAAGIEFSIDREALGPGGVRTFFRLTNAEVQKLTLVVAIIAVILTATPIVRDRGLATLQKRDLELSIKEHELNIEKLRKEISAPTSAPVSEVTSRAVAVLQADAPVIYHRAAFYRKVIAVEKVTQLSFSASGQNGVVVPEIVIPSSDFPKYIISSDELPTVRDESAKIEILAPVLKGGRIKWKGIYDGRTIDFYMRDEEFRKAVESREIVFKSGDMIECVLEMERRISEVGEEEMGPYAVTTVVTRYEDGREIKTQQGVSYRARRANEKAQMKFWEAP
jgi:hypothetical protein